MFQNKYLSSIIVNDVLVSASGINDINQIKDRVLKEFANEVWTNFPNKINIKDCIKYYRFIIIDSAKRVKIRHSLFELSKIEPFDIMSNLNYNLSRFKKSHMKKDFDSASKWLGSSFGIFILYFIKLREIMDPNLEIIGMDILRIQKLFIEHNNILSLYSELIFARPAFEILSDVARKECSKDFLSSNLKEFVKSQVNQYL